MKEYDIKRLALILAVQAEIEGMKAENARCDIFGFEPAFDNVFFKQKAFELRNLAEINFIPSDK